MSMHSTLHPSPQSIECHGELEHKESSLPDFAAHSISFLGPSDSWRYKSDNSNFPDKKSFTDYAIVHRTQRSQRSSDQTMPSVRFDPNEIENNIVTVQRPIHVQRPDFSFAKQRSNNFSEKAAVESVDKTIDAYGINTKEFTGEQISQQVNVEEEEQDKSLEMYMNQMLDVSQKVEEEVADKTIETYFSNTMDVSEKIKLETANLKAKYLASLDSEFKPSRLFSITEKLSTVMKTMKTLKQDEAGTQKVNPEGEISQDLIQENKKKEEHEPKRTTVNLMDLIIEYTKNPNLEQKIKMTKRSFINKKNNNKENQPEDASMTLETSQGVGSQNTQNSYPARQSRKEKEKNFVQLNKCVKDTMMTLSSSTKKHGSQDRTRSVSKEQQKTRSTSRTPGKLSNSQIRSKSGERYFSTNNRLNQSAIESSTLMTSQLRSTSCQRRGSLAASGANSTAFLNELGINCTMFRKDEESVIMTLKETMQKLLDKTEVNREQIRQLKLSQGDTVTSLEVNKAKVSYYKQKTAAIEPNFMQRRRSSMTSCLQKAMLQQNDPKIKNQNTISDYNSYSVLEARNRELEKILSEKTQELDQFHKILNNLQQEGPKISEVMRKSRPQPKKNENQYEMWRSILNEKNY